MKSEIIPYKPVHAYELFDRQVQEAGLFMSKLGDWKRAANQWETAGPAFTLMVDGRVETCGGIALIDDTLGECWAFVPQHNDGFLIYRNILKKFKELVNERNYRRLQSYVVEGFNGGCRLVERLGFEKEGIARNYGVNGENMIMYSKVF